MRRVRRRAGGRGGGGQRANGRPNQFHTPPDLDGGASVTVSNPISDMVIREWARKCEAFNQRGLIIIKRPANFHRVALYLPPLPCPCELMNGNRFE